MLAVISKQPGKISSLDLNFHASRTLETPKASYGLHDVSFYYEDQEANSRFRISEHGSWYYNYSPAPANFSFPSLKAVQSTHIISI